MGEFYCVEAGESFSDTEGSAVAGALVMTLGAVGGGYLAAHYSQKLPQSWIRGFVIFVGAAMTIYFFWRAYGGA